MLLEAGMLGCRPINSPMDANSKLLRDQRAILDNLRQYGRLVGKLNYLIITRPNVAHPVSVVSQFLSALRTSHWDVVIQIL